MHYSKCEAGTETSLLDTSREVLAPIEARPGMLGNRHWQQGGPSCQRTGRGHSQRPRSTDGRARASTHAGEDDPPNIANVQGKSYTGHMRSTDEAYLIGGGALAAAAAAIGRRRHVHASGGGAPSPPPPPPLPPSSSSAPPSPAPPLIGASLTRPCGRFRMLP